MYKEIENEKLQKKNGSSPLLTFKKNLINDTSSISDYSPFSVPVNSNVLILAIKGWDYNSGMLIIL